MSVKYGYILNEDGTTTPQADPGAVQRGEVVALAADSQMLGGKAASSFLQMEILYENGSPTNSFDAGEITHSAFGDTTQYQLLMICTNKQTLIVLNEISTSSVFTSYASAIGTTGYYINTRSFLVSNGYVGVGVNYEMSLAVNSSGASTTTIAKSNSNNIPVKIYGIKGVV